jgi:hypothetical protein
MPFAEGDIIYSEGYHDEFHQFLWNRLLWSPNAPLEQVMLEYARLHFGPAAAPEMVQAMLQLEENLEAPLAANEGIDRCYLLVKSAGWKIPPQLMRENHRWRLHMQHAALDKYLQLKLRRESDLQQRALRTVEQGLASADPQAAAQGAAILAEPVETPDMAALRAEAGRLGEESNALFGVRDVGYFRLDQDLVGGAWLRQELQRARSAPEGERRQMLALVAHYEDPGPGGYYDCAQEGRHPHLVRGETYHATQWLDPANRPSQNSIAYTLGPGPGVAFRYPGLDRSARYRVRLTMVIPRFPQAEQPGMRSRQHVLADGEYLAKDVEIPAYTARQFEYPVPPAATRDGILELALERAEGGMGTVVSEVWLIKEP